MLDRVYELTIGEVLRADTAKLDAFAELHRSIVTWAGYRIMLRVEFAKKTN